MALLPDLALASLYAVVVFLLALGFLVVFIEVISMRRLLAGLVLTLVVAAGAADDPLGTSRSGSQRLRGRRLQERRRAPRGQGQEEQQE